MIEILSALFFAIIYGVNNYKVWYDIMRNKQIRGCKEKVCQDYSRLPVF